MFLKADIVNGMINTMIIEIVVYVVSLIVAKYILKLNKKEFIRVVFIMAIKYIIVNPIMTYFRNTGYNKEPYTYWMSITNIFVAFLIVSLLILATKQSYALIMGSISILFDIVMVFFYMVPYYAVTIFWMKSEPFFFGKDFDINLLWKYGVLIFYFIVITILFARFCKKYADKIRGIINRVPIVAAILFGADLAIGTVGFLYNSIFYDRKIFMYYLGTVALGLFMIYGVTILVREERAKKLREENKKLNLENEKIKERSGKSNKNAEEDRKFRHDIDKHMNVINEMMEEGASEEEIKEYAEGIKETYK